MKISPAKTILLTGAGFTKPFNGYLSSEMWGLILNQPEVEQYPKLRHCLLGNPNFEKVYDLIQVDEEKNYSKEEREAFTRALERAYRQLHNAVSERFNILAAEFCREFVACFASINPEEIGFTFTLNHDLFIERYFAVYDPLRTICVPGLNSKNWFRAASEEAFEIEHVQLFDRGRVEELDASFWNTKSAALAYIKLHGSLGWKAVNGTESIVVGTIKASAIQNEPLLKWNSSIFEKVIHSGNRILLVIGYSFRDEHINCVIKEGIQSHGLRLIVVNTQSPEQFRNVMNNLNVPVGQPIPYGPKILEGLVGYYPISTRQLMNDLGSPSADGEALLKRLNLV